MKNERAIEILKDLSAWINDDKSLYWSAGEISKAVAYAKVEIYPLFAAKVLQDYRDWLEFGKPFYHTLGHLNSALSIAIETLQLNKKQP